MDVLEMEITYCPDLWEMFKLDNKGNVFHCCHIQPAILGNIYEKALYDLINAPTSLRYRNQSLNGSLECYKECNWVDRGIPRNAWHKNLEIDYSSLKQLHLHFGEICNISCIMCRERKRNPSDRVILDYKKIIENIDIDPFEDIVLSGGEPLAITSCMEYMDYLESIGKKYILLTNGLLIDDTLAERLSRHAKKVVISINAATSYTHSKINIGSNFSRVLSNIKSLRKYKSKYHSRVEIIGRMTITVPALAEVQLLIRNYRDLGFDSINFGYDKATVSDHLRANPDFRSKLKKEVDKALRNSCIERIELKRLKQLCLLDEANLYDIKRSKEWFP